MPGFTICSRGRRRSLRDSSVQRELSISRVCAGEYKESERCIARRELESELLDVVRPYVGEATAPERVLAKRIEQFIAELFTFVQYPEVPSENNAAERAIRPVVVARKISGGTRSPKGSKTSSILRTLFETWALQGRNTLDACRQTLIDSNGGASPAPP